MIHSIKTHPTFLEHIHRGKESDKSQQVFGQLHMSCLRSALRGFSRIAEPAHSTSSFTSASAQGRANETTENTKVLDLLFF